MAQEVVKTSNQEVTTKAKSLMQSQQQYVSAIANGLADIIGSCDQEQVVCGYNILNAINEALAKDGLTHNSPDIDKESINNAIKFALVYRLNTDNKEVFVNIRKVNISGVWKKKVEVKTQYKGTLKILQKYGVNVKKVHTVWVVRENDEFIRPRFVGIKKEPPVWTPKGEGKIVCVCVPVEYNDGDVDYCIAERESVATNLKAQIKNTLLGEKNEVKKNQVLTLIQDMTLDELLKNDTVKEYINDTYTGIMGEEMLITKLTINAIKRVQVDYGNAFKRELIESTYDNAYDYKKKTATEIVDQEVPLIENNNDVPEITVNEETGEVTKPSAEPVKQQPAFDDDGGKATIESMFPEDF